LVPYDKEEYGYVTTKNFDLQVPQNRSVIFSKVSWEGDHFSVYGQLHAADVSSTRPMPPVPFVGFFPITLQGNPFLSPEAQMAFFNTPEVMFGGATQGVDFDGDGIPNVMPFFIGKWMEGLGETRWQVQNDMLQVNLGFEWDLNDSWGLSGKVNQGEITYDSKIGPGVVRERGHCYQVPLTRLVKHAWTRVMDVCLTTYLALIKLRKLRKIL